MLAADVWRVAQQWVTKAEGDLRNIELVLPADDPPFDTVCYRAQQVAEKYLKALLVCYGVAPRRTHDLAVLLDQLPDTSMVPSRVGDVEEVTHGAVEARYPSEAEPLGRADAERLVAAALIVKQAVLDEMAALHESTPGA